MVTVAGNCPNYLHARRYKGLDLVNKLVTQNAQVHGTCMCLILVLYAQKHTFHVDVHILIDISLTVKAATLIFISGCCSAISSGCIYNLVKR